MIKRLPIVFVLVFTVCSAATLAQTAPNDPNKYLDLPIEPPVYGQSSTGAPPVKPEPKDDPRDEPLPKLYGEEIDAETDTIIYVVDISGSMGWDFQFFTAVDGARGIGSRLDRAKAELVRSISGLSENFRFDVIAFDCGLRQWRSELQRANQTNKAASTSWVMSLEPGSGTGTGPAVALGLMMDKQNKTIVLLTDGAPNCGTVNQTMVEHRSMIRAANTQRAAINVFGIAAYGSYRGFCQAIASESGGSYFDVP